MQTATLTPARPAPQAEPPHTGLDAHFRTPIGIPAVAAAAAQMQRARREEALRALDCRREIPAVLQDHDLPA